MVGGPRAYGAGVERALYRLARGTCYYPDCAQPVIVAVDGAPVVAVEIAHIRGAKEGSARYDATMTDEERASFANLILLCSPHHKMVDRIRPADYSVETLEAWKQTNEPAEGIEALRASGLNDLILDQVIEDVVSRLGPIRQVEVDLDAGLEMNSREAVALGDLSALQGVLRANEHLLQIPRIVVASVRNVGTIPASIESVDLWLVFDEHADAGFSLVGRNDFAGRNPSLPYRLLDGDALRWFTRLDSIQMIVAAAREHGLSVAGVQARVRLGSGETIESDLLGWVDV